MISLSEQLKRQAWARVAIIQKNELSAYMRVWGQLRFPPALRQVAQVRQAAGILLHAETGTLYRLPVTDPIW